MKRTLIPVLILMFVTMACALTGGGETVQPPAPTTAVEIQPTEARPPTEAPAPTEAPPPTEAPQAEPTEAVSNNNDAGDYFVEKFDGDLSDWTPFVVAGDAKKEYAEVVGGQLKIELPNNETYAYVENTAHSYQDVYVETEVETVKGGENGIALFCRGSSKGWYEFRIHTMGRYAGTLEAYRFDAKLRERNKVPYVNLLKGQERLSTYDIKAGLNMNDLGLMCVNNEIRLFINGVEQLPMPGGKPIYDDVLSEGTVGVAAMSFSQGFVHVEFSSVSTSAP